MMFIKTKLVACFCLFQIGPFILFGSYTSTMKMNFTKQYIDRHSIAYFGEIDIESESGKIILIGSWGFPNIDESGKRTTDAQDRFRIDIPHKKNHVMFSYQWGSQETVKRVVEYMDSQGIPTWFDIAG